MLPRNVTSVFLLLFYVGTVLSTSIDLNPAEHQITILYNDNACEEPAMIRYHTLTESNLCQQNTTCGEIDVDIGRTVCNSKPLVDYGLEVLKDRPFIVYRWFDDLSCDIRGGNSQVDTVVADGKCRRGAQHSILEDNSVLIIDHPDSLCQTEPKTVTRLFPSDIEAKTCKRGNWAYHLYYVSNVTRTATVEPTVEPTLDSPSPSTSEVASESSSFGTIGLIAGILILLGLVVAGFLWYRRRQNKAKDAHPLQIRESDYVGMNSHNKRCPSNASGTNSLTTTSQEALRAKFGGLNPQPEPALFADAFDQLGCRLSKEDLVDVRELGRGGFAVVWLVLHQQSSLFASKRLKDAADFGRLRRFIEEIQLNAMIAHPHIVKLTGVAWSTAADLEALFEYMEQGDVRHWLQTTKPLEASAWSPIKTRIALDVLEALHYVHSLKRPIVHRDLKSGNVLLTKDMRAKLSDFGVARLQSYEATMTAGVGTVLWLAPEVLAGHNDYDHRADMYSFGVLLSELDTHELPFHHVRTEEGGTMSHLAIMHHVVTGTLTPMFSNTLPDSVSELAHRCVSHDPKHRPSAQEALALLRPLLQDIH